MYRSLEPTAKQLFLEAIGNATCWSCCFVSLYFVALLCYGWPTLKIKNFIIIHLNWSLIYNALEQLYYSVAAVSAVAAFAAAAVAGVVVVVVIFFVLFSSIFRRFIDAKASYSALLSM